MPVDPIGKALDVNQDTCGVFLDVSPRLVLDSVFLGKDVAIEGLAMFRPSGKLLRIDADAIAAAVAKDAFFSKLPLASVGSDFAIASRSRPGQLAYASLLGLIPGDESEEEFIHALEELS